MNLPESLEVVGIWRRLLAEALDGIVILPVAVFLFLPVQYWALERDAAGVVAVSGLFWIGIFVWCLVRFGGTPGKLILRMRVVDANGAYLRWIAAVIREAPAWVALALVTGAISTAAGQFDGFNGTASFGQFNETISGVGGPYATLQSWWAYFLYADVLTILVNRYRRALHDYIAGSVVVTRSSYMRTARLRGVIDAPAN